MSRERSALPFVVVDWRETRSTSRPSPLSWNSWVTTET
jgi:hypothetical protein